jgi:hypothetical protein
MGDFKKLSGSYYKDVIPDDERREPLSTASTADAIVSCMCCVCCVLVQY